MGGRAAGRLLAGGWAAGGQGGGGGAWVEWLCGWAGGWLWRPSRPGARPDPPCRRPSSAAGDTAVAAISQTRDQQAEIDRLRVQLAETGGELAEAQRQGADKDRELAEAQARAAALQSQLAVAERQRDEVTNVAAAQVDEAGQELQQRVGGPREAPGGAACACPLLCASGPQQRLRGRAAAAPACALYARRSPRPIPCVPHSRPSLAAALAG
jgi:hypothetical protein